MFTTVSEALESYNEQLDELSNVHVGGQQFDGSRVLKALDPIAYRTGFHDWLDAIGVDSDDLEGSL